MSGLVDGKGSAASILRGARGRRYTVATGGAPPEPLWRYLLPDLGHPSRRVSTPGPQDGDAVQIVDGIVGCEIQEPDRVLYLPGPPVTEGRLGHLAARIRRVVARLWRRMTGRTRSHVTVADRPGFDPTRPGDRTALTMLAPPGVALSPLPRYLAEIAEAQGFDLTEHTIRLIPPAGYRQQKIIFLTTDPHGAPGLAIKMTQHASANERLMAEHAGLEEVVALVPDGTVPAPRFAVEHDGLVVVGQDVAVGRPFSQGSDGTVTDAGIAELMEWATSLGHRSARTVPGSDLAEALADLIGRFGRTYGSGAPVRQVHADVDLIGGRAAVPVVFGHGDLGFWNVVVGDDGTQVVCDWENAEPQAPPLWDVFYAGQTYAAWAGERAGYRFTSGRFATQLLDPASPWAGWLWGHVTTAADVTGVDHDLIMPLVRTSLAFSALKESTRLRADRLHHGRYVGMLAATAGLAEPPA